MNENVLLAASVLVPVVGALLLPLLGRLSGRLREAAALAAVLTSFACAAALVPAVSGGATFTVSAGDLALLHADRLAVLMALVSTGLGAVIVVYSAGYLAGARAHRGEYDLMVVLFLGAMTGLVFARNLVVLYACWEVTALACWRLVAFFRREDAVLRADKAFLVTGLGAVVMLLGFVEVYAQAGTFDLGRLAGQPLSALATGLILVGLFSKSATLPLHSWLPDAGVAPSPVTALLHAAVLVKIGVYVYARLFGATFVMDPGWQAAVPWIAGASALVAGAAALREHDLKRIVAYSTVSQLAFVFLGLSAGGATAAGGALLFIAVHAVAKGGLFLCAGVVEHAVHTKDVRRMGGLARHLPVTTAAFALCALSVMGLPPLAGFFAKHLVVAGAFAGPGPVVGLAFVAGSALTVLYLARAFVLVFLGAEGEAVRGHAVHEGTRGMVACVALLAALAVAGGLGVGLPAALAEGAARDLVRLPGPLAGGLGLHLALVREGPYAAPLLAAVAALALGLGPLALRALPGRRAAAGAAAAVGVAAVAGVVTGHGELTQVFAWELFLVPLLVLLGAAGGKATGAARRAFLVCAVADLVLVAGFGLLEAHGGHAAVALGGVLLVTGAAARLGALPFHAWIADAAEDVPAPALALVVSLGKVAAAALLARAALEHDLLAGAARPALAALGALSVAGGLALAVVQRDARRRAGHGAAVHAGAVLLALAAGQVTLGLALAVAGAAVVALHLLAAARAPVAAAPGGALADGLRALERSFEPTRFARRVAEGAAAVLFRMERGVNAVYDLGATGAVRLLAKGSRRAHDGRHSTYLVWSMLGLAAVVLHLVGVL